MENMDVLTSQENHSPVTAAQKEIWLLQQRSPLLNFNISKYAEIEGEINPQLLKQAVQYVCTEFPALQSTFSLTDGELRQYQNHTTTPTLNIINLTAQNNNNNTLDAWIENDMNTLSDLEKGPLFSLSLLITGKNRFIFYHRYHHILTDGRSICLIAKHISERYNTLCQKISSPTIEPSSPATLAMQDNHYLHSPRFQQDTDYWLSQQTNTQQLAQFSDHPALRDIIKQQQPIDPTELRRLTELASQYQLNLSHVLIAATAVWFYTLTGQQTLSFSFPVTGCSKAGQLQVGMTANTLPLRLVLADGNSFHQLMNSVKHQLSALMRHQRYRGEDLLRQSQTSSFGPVINLIFFSHGAPFYGTTTRWVTSSGSQTQGFSVMFDDDGFGNDLAVSFYSSASRHPREQLQRYQQQFHALLSQLTAHPDTALNQLTTLNEEQRRHLLYGLNQTSLPTDPRLTLHGAFSRQAQLTPQAIALSDISNQFSYQQVEQQVNHLAQQLVAAGSAIDQPVALCMTRSCLQIVTLLAIAKSGGCYLPLDPTWPPVRLKSVLEQAQPALLLTDDTGREALGALAEIVVWNVQQRLELPAPQLSILPQDARSLAYILFTSGSTGQPKGVMVEHAQLMNLYAGLKQSVFNYYPAAARVCLNATLSFDASLQSILAMVAGWQLVVMPEEIRRDGRRLLAFLQQQQIAVFDCTPTQLEMLSMAGLEHHPLPLVLLIGGESLPAARWKWLGQQPHITAFNLYGPTECTVDATVAHITTDDPHPTIGRPLANTRLYLLDTRHQLVPFGASGQLWIGGAGVSRGYFARPDLTRQRYLPDPFLNDGSRIYASGDLARYRADGQLEYLARDDDQVKINGFRIEPGEIEQHLLQSGAISQVAVTVRQTPPAENVLICYYVAATTEPPAGMARQLRDELMLRLPAWMVPQAWVALPALPLTSNGKTDRRALPAPDPQAWIHEQYQPPEGEAELQLQQLWSELLQQPQPGRHDNFFALGGDSLLAMKLLARLHTRGWGKLNLSELFAHPTLATQAALLGDGKEQQSEEIIVQSNRQRFPLSSSQRQLWFINQMASENENYLVPLLLNLHGPLVEQQLQDALNTLLTRHHGLRATFHSDHGDPWCQLLPEGSCVPFTYQDLRNGVDPQVALAALYQQQINTPFDLSQGPLVRATLAHLADDRYQLLLIIHHIVTDGASMAILLRELITLYSHTSALPPLTIHYPDYAVWQQQQQDSPRWQSAEKYWLQQLAGLPERLTLPTDHPRPHRQSFTGDSLPVVLDCTLTAQLRHLARQHGCTLFMLIVSAWSVVLSRLSGQRDLAIGIPLNNRPLQQCEPLMGFFVNTLPLRIDLSEELTISALLTQVRQNLLAMQQHQTLPFTELVSMVQPQRSLDKSPLFQVVCSWESSTSLPVIGDLIPELQDPPITQVKFDLELMLTEQQQCVQGSLNFASALFDADSVARQRDYLLNLLQQLTAADQPVQHLPLLSDAERQRQLDSWNPAATPWPQHLAAHQMFEQQVVRQPQAIALRMGDIALSYHQLNQRANYLAYQLIEQGLGREQRVLICTSRSVEMVVAMLATMKARAAWLVVPPDVPDARLQFILTDAAPAAILCSHHASTHFADTVIPLLTISTEDPAVPLADPALPGEPQDLAYLIYTSGSTGQPKGVMAEQRNLAQMMYNWAIRWQVGPGSQLLQFCSITFDASVADIFTALGSGATLVLREDHWLDGSHHFWQQCRDYSISHMLLPWQFWRMLCEESQPMLPDSLRVVWVGGEAAEPQLLTSWLQRYPDGPQLVNCYGPTEASVIATTHQPQLGEAVIESIGQPLANTRVYILDEAGNLLPQGAVGELTIGGAGVVRGYLNRDDLTAACFIPDPFSPQPGTWMYRSGDLASWLPDGRLHYHGRNDHQVKLRGFRIEPEEIEAQLNRHPQVKESLVVALDNQQGNKQLVAWLVPAAGEWPTESALTAWLAQSLPDYMIPTTLMLLERMPISENGKLDRKALPQPVLQQPAATVVNPPQNETELLLAAIWQSLLQQPVSNRDANFFTLGGHSLLAVRMVSQIARQLGRSVPLAVLFDHPQLCHLATWIDQHATSAPVQTEFSVIDRQQRLPLSFAQQRLWFLHQFEKQAANYNVLLILQLYGEVDPRALQQALNCLWARHDALRSQFVMVDDQPQVVLAPAENGIPLAIHDYRGGDYPAEQLQRFYLQQESQTFDLANDSLLSANWLKLTDRHSVLVLTLHHIITDGWSMGILARELGQAYSALLSGHPPRLPALPQQYPDYAAWQLQWRNSAEWQAQGHYWRQQLADIPALLTLPTNRPRPPQQSTRSGSLPLQLDEALTARLLQLSQRHHCTLFITLLSAWSVVLGRLASQSDVVIGSPAANRSQAECEEIVGFFVNMLCLRVQLPTEITVAELLTQVRQTTLAAQENQALPFDQVVELLQPQRSMEYQPLFQVMFALENNDDLIPTMKGLDVLLEEPAPTQVKYDLELSLGEHNGRISGRLNFRRELFDRATMERQLGYLLRVLEAMAADDSIQVSRIALLNDGERQQLLARHGTDGNWPQQVCIHHLFEQQAARQPEAIALIAGDLTLSYAQLNRQANHLAERLIASRIVAQDLVAICAERSPELIVAILATLKAGAAWFYLPADSSEQRLKFMLEDARPKQVLAQATTLARFATLIADCWLLAGIEALPEHDANPQPDNVDAHNLACLIYTSGSTGNPKGVLVEHANLVQNIVPWCRRWEIDVNSRVLQFCNLSFDVSGSEIFSALISGGALVLRDDDWLNGTDHFWQQCDHYAVSHMDLPYQFWNQLCEESSAPLPAALKTIVFGGESAAAQRLEQWVARYPQRPTLVNCYGPTETTITVTANCAGQQTCHIDAIGYPLDNVRCYILDQHGQLLPDGCIGELFIGGPCVVRGYLNLPETTARHFVADPFNPQPDARMYRSGDLASWLPDGRLMFHGRGDQQVKIRGFRIEPGEIETLLNRHPQVRNSLVLAQPAHGSQRLVAWIVPAGIAPSHAELRDYLAAALPDYMVPAAWVILDALPLNASGKINHKALPQPVDTMQEHDGEPLQPGLESTLAAIWQQLLGCPIGRNDNFFELGGHSLLAVRCVTRLNRQGDVRCSVNDIFNAPTIKRLALRLSGKGDQPTLLDLSTEARLAPDIQALPATATTGSDILLTGASGFVGRFLLRQLLDSGEQQVWCLVRGESPAACQQRLEQVMHDAQLWHRKDAGRVKVICGDLRQPQLGLDDATWQRLSHEVGTIWHAAVSMNHLESWSMAQAANISGLKEMLRLTTQGGRKIFNFISTNNVFSPLGGSGERWVDEHSSIAHEQHLSSQGYTASKWVGEEMVNQAVARGVPCNILRLGLITPDAKLARYDRLQAFDRLLRSSLQMGMAFTDVLGDIPLLPVDFAAAALHYLGSRWQPGQHIWHLSAPQAISREQFMQRLNARLEQPMQLVTHKNWLQEAQRRHQQGETLPITPLIQDLLLASNEQLEHYYQTLRHSVVTVDSTLTFRTLSEAGLLLPPADDAWFARLITTLREETDDSPAR